MLLNPNELRAYDKEKKKKNTRFGMVYINIFICFHSEVIFLSPAKCFHMMSVFLSVFFLYQKLKQKIHLILYEQTENGSFKSMNPTE